MWMSESPKTSVNPCTCCEVIVILCSVVFVIGVFTIPTVLYFSNRNEADQSWKTLASTVFSVLENCEERDGGMNNLTQSVNEANITSSVNCSILTSENPCFSHLESFLETTKSSITRVSSSPIRVKSAIDSSIISQNLESVHSAFTLKCKSDGLPLYCKFLYSPCTSGMEQFTLTENECTSLKSEYCEKEFLFLSMLSKLKSNYLPLIPNCNALEPAAATDQIGGETHNISQDGSTITAVDNRSDPATNRSSLVCHPDYVETCGLCLFSCKRSIDLPIWPGLRLSIDDIFQCFFSALTVLFASTFIVLAIAKRNKMFKFPSILLFYANLLELFIGILILGALIGGPDLFCSSPDFLRTILSPPTVFCSISGFLFHFATLSIFTVWTVHLGYIIILLMFPIYGELVLKKKTRIIHAIFVPLALFVCLIPPIVAISTKGYSVVRFPPSMCLPASFDLVYYTLSLPASVIMCVLAILGVLIIFLIHKSLTQAKKLKVKVSGQRESFFSAQETKILLLSIFIVFLGVFVLARFSYTLSSAKQYSQVIHDDGLCHIHGNISSETCGSNRESLLGYPITSIVSYLLLSLLPLSKIVFVFSLSNKKKSTKFCSVCKDNEDNDKKKSSV